ncbi:hypothetical protein TTHERM_000578573 (macronuclear) [Tetrahymena thermophila SB210]|uniref:Uncharacterized protein n=1 Tax=Tetrahymena thermophila (strain SB210) TaxID=312017 RepID=W7XEV5_TETTS|nr:hypothetical protein TTHERM_000578573 [Tetrahymena thermophila SB210]EWS72511.1 hypothetical protein TTHERM_000578573 [Tetrahymena thermophila SB210]|eukprot:XP_012654947.1 hypothetical protein TTHERM_000578573 [Tetrahymena thermophila SB210]
MNTIQRICFKDNSQYVGNQSVSLLYLIQKLFINQKTGLLIICQQISVRIFSLNSLDYQNSIYDNQLNLSYFFYNKNYNYLIYSQIYYLIFIQLDLNTMIKINLQLPPPNSISENQYRFFFLDDQQTYIFLNSDFKFIYLFDQRTHNLINQILLDEAFYFNSDVIVDQKNQYIFLFDINNSINHYSYSTKQLIQKYQVNQFIKFFQIYQFLFIKLCKLNQSDASVFQKNMIWDSYKQRIIASSNATVYLINVQTKLIELQLEDTFVTQLQLFESKNIIQYSNYYNNVLLDYDYLLNNNKDTFPNQINPRFFNLNENSILYLSYFSSQIYLFINQKITSTWIRNNFNWGYIR